MPRNGSGVYTLPAGNPVSPGTVIESNWANTTLEDLANEMTNSLSRNGSGGMLAPFQLFDGTVAAPGLSFTLEPSTGMWREGPGLLAWSILGSKKLNLTANALQTASGMAMISERVSAQKGTEYSGLDFLVSAPTVPALRLYRAGIALYDWTISDTGALEAVLNGDGALWQLSLSSAGILKTKGHVNDGYPSRTNSGYFTGPSASLDAGSAPNMARGVAVTPAGGTLLVPFGHNLSNPIITLSVVSPSAVAIATIEGLDATQFALGTWVWNGTAFVRDAVQVHWQAISQTPEPY